MIFMGKTRSETHSTHPSIESLRKDEFVVFPANHAPSNLENVMADRRKLTRIVIFPDETNPDYSMSIVWYTIYGTPMPIKLQARSTFLSSILLGCRVWYHESDEYSI